WFNADDAYTGNDVAIGFRNDDVNGEGRTYVIGYEVVLKIEEPDPMIAAVDDRFDELACVAHGKLDLVFGTSGTLDSLAAVISDIFGYPAAVEASEIQRVKNSYGGLGNGQSAWVDAVEFTFTNPETGNTYDKEMDLSLMKMVYGKYAGAIEDTGFLGCCPDEWPDDVSAVGAVNDWSDATTIELGEFEYTVENVEAWFREQTGLGDDWAFYSAWFDADDAYGDGNEIALALRNDDVNGEGRTIILAGGPILKASVAEISLTGSITLNDSIDINIYVNNVSEALAASGRVAYSVDGGETFEYANFDDEHFFGDGKFGFNVAQFNANQMTKEVIFLVYDGEEVIAEINYSVKDYCDKQIAESGNADLAALCEALMAYGYYAQQRFPATASDPINPEEYADAIASIGMFEQDLSDYNVAVQKNAPVTAVSASLALESKTALNIYLTGTNDVDPVVTVDGQAWDGKVYDEEVNSTKCRVVLTLTTLDMLSEFTVVCGDTSVTYSPMAYVANAVNNNTANSDVCKALCLFSYAAWHFFNQ
ncbi:MAG: hypothetical protein IKI03_08050, partial [Clostridia bacterium]|nr:hypothetical protein [Clostridia bacterium]